MLLSLFWPLFGQRLPDGPRVTTTLVQAMIASQARTRLEALPNEVLLEPSTPDDFNFLSWSKHRELLRFSDEWARNWLADNPEALSLLKPRTRGSGK